MPWQRYRVSRKPSEMSGIASLYFGRNFLTSLTERQGAVGDEEKEKKKEKGEDKVLRAEPSSLPAKQLSAKESLRVSGSRLIARSFKHSSLLNQLESSGSHITSSSRAKKGATNRCFRFNPSVGRKRKSRRPSQSSHPADTFCFSTWQRHIFFDLCCAHHHDSQSKWARKRTWKPPKNQHGP